jgi:hypothetical protein
LKTTVNKAAIGASYMTRSDYFLIAKAIKNAFSGTEKSENGLAKRRLLKELIPAMKADNPNFQAFRFLLACDAEELWDDTARRYIA